MPDEYDFTALSALGLSTRAIDAYSALLVNDEPLSAEALDELRLAGLIDDAHGATLPRPAGEIVAGWVQSRAEEERDVRRAVSTLGDLLEQYEQRNSRSFLTYVRGIGSVSSCAHALMRGAHVSVDEFVGGPFHQLQALAQQADGGPTLRAGVRHRAVYDVAILKDPAHRVLLDGLMARGQEARSHPSVPMRILIVDGKTALIVLAWPVVDRGSDREALGIDGLLVRKSPLVGSFVRMFEQHWHDGIDLAELKHTGDTGDDRLLQLLAQGLTDQTISAMLGVSARTVQRRVAEITATLGVSGRFQLGMEAQRRGLVE